jgi:hypothetical protein
VERVVLNALAEDASDSRLILILFFGEWHRLEDKPIHQETPAIIR